MVQAQLVNGWTCLRFVTVDQSETFLFQLFFLDRGAPLKKTWNQDNGDDRPKWPEKFYRTSLSKSHFILLIHFAGDEGGEAFFIPVHFAVSENAKIFKLFQQFIVFKNPFPFKGSVFQMIQIKCFIKY